MRLKSAGWRSKKCKMQKKGLKPKLFFEKLRFAIVHQQAAEGHQLKINIKNLHSNSNKQFCRNFLNSIIQDKYR